MNEIVIIGDIKNDFSFLRTNILNDVVISNQSSDNFEKINLKNTALIFYRIDRTEDIYKVHKVWEKNNLVCPIIFLSQTYYLLEKSLPENLPYFVLPLYSESSVLEAVTQKSLKLAKRFVKEDRKYLEISILNLISYNQINSDLYLKLSDEKYVKAIHKDTELYAKEIVHFKEKGVKYLYVLEKDYLIFLESVSTLENDFLKASKSLSQEFVSEIAGKSFNLAHQAISLIGLKKKTLELANKSLSATYEMIKKTKSFEQAWNSLIKKQNYFLEHSLVLSYIASEVVTNFRYTSGLDVSQICMASLFHDIGYLDEEVALSHVDNHLRKENKPTLQGFSKKTIEYSKHPLKALELIEKIKGIPFDVHKMVLEHHEEPDKTGFPRSLSFSQLTPISMLFNVTHQFVKYMYVNGFNKYNRDICINMLKEKSLDAKYVAIVNALEESFNK